MRFVAYNFDFLNGQSSVCSHLFLRVVNETSYAFAPLIITLPILGTLVHAAWITIPRSRSSRYKPDNIIPIELMNDL